MDLIWITKANLVKDFVLNLTFNDGLNKNVDFEPILRKRSNLFKEILNPENFKEFKLNDWTISWLNGRLDIAPEYLYQV